NSEAIDPYIDIKSILKGFDFGIVGSDSVSMNEKIKNDFKEVGGIAGIVKWLLPPSNDEHFFRNQIIEFFNKKKASDFNYLSEMEFLSIKEKILKNSNNIDSEYVRMVLSSLVPGQENVYSLPQSTSSTSNINQGNESVSKKFLYRESLEVTKDEISLIISLIKKYILSRTIEKPIQINGHQVVLKFTDPNQINIYKNKLMQAFKASNWRTQQASEILEPAILEMKSYLADNTLRVLEATDTKVTEINYTDLITKLSQINSSKLNGVTISDLTLDLMDLYSFETILKN
ncbi:MAG: hypothetical protein KDD45_04195, partial [Bdellovibrionales bacterium]|nr:hypothetical protein [Bdellovibrionales bacterium]